MNDTNREWDLIAFWDVIMPIRFSLLVIGIAGWALIANDQVQDMLVGLGGYRSFLFVIAVTWWAVQSWGWARWILNTEARTERATLAADGGLAWLVKNLPRILGICAFGVASFAAWTSDQTLIAVILVLIGIVTYYFFVRRLAWSELPRLNWLDSDTVPQRITWVLLLLAAICGTFIPVRMGEWLGAGAIAFFGLGCLIPAGTWIVHLGRTRRLPALTILIIVAIVFSYFNDNHRIRTLSSEPGVPVPGLTLKDALDQWYSQAPKNINGADNDPVPMVLVAAAGGGLRATFWTTSVLGKLERGTADFHQHIFAISGISGGALGGVLYASALSQLPQDAEPEVRRSFADKLARASGQDYLGVARRSFLDKMTIIIGQLFKPFLTVISGQLFKATLLSRKTGNFEFKFLLHLTLVFETEAAA